MALIPDITNAVTAYMPGIASFIGEEYLTTETAAPPRIVWIPTSDNFGPATQRGSSQADPRALHTCRSAVDVHCWGVGFAEAGALRDAFILALRTVVGPNYALGAGRWVGKDYSAAGRVYILSLTIDVPITDAAPAVATPPLAVPTTINFSPSPGP